MLMKELSVKRQVVKQVLETRGQLAGIVSCLALFDPSQRNCFRKSQLTSVVAIGLQKPFAKMKVGEFCTV